MIRDRRLRGIVPPLVLIAVGAILLLNSLDVLAWSVWPDIARWWPVLVIALGARLLWEKFKGREA